MEGILNEVARFREGKKPENGREGLKKYDPEAYGLFDRFFTEGTEIPKMEPRRKKPPVRVQTPSATAGLRPARMAIGQGRPGDGPGENRGESRSTPLGSDRLHVDRPGTFAPLALLDLVFDGLPFLKGVKARADDGGMVKEHLAPLAADKPETPVRNQLLDGTLRHICHSL